MNQLFDIKRFGSLESLRSHSKRLNSLATAFSKIAILRTRSRNRGLTSEVMEIISALRCLTTKEAVVKDMLLSPEGKGFLRAMNWTYELSDNDLEGVRAKDVISAFHKEMQTGSETDAKKMAAEYVDGLKTLSELHQNRGYLAEAIKLKEEEILVTRSVQGKCERFYSSLIKLAVLLKQSEKEEDALDTLRYVYKNAKTGWDDLPLNFWNTFATLLYEKHEYKKALKCFEEVFTRDKASGQQEKVLIGDLRNLVAVKLKAGMKQEAAHTQEELLCLMLKTKDKQEAESNISLIASESKRLGLIYSGIGKHKEAVIAFQSSLSGYETLKEFDNMAEAHYQIGNSQLQTGESNDAIQHFKLSLKLYRQVCGEKDLRVASVLEGLGGAYKAENDYETAISCFKRAFAIRNQREGLESTNTAMCQYSIADLLVFQNCKEEALRLLRVALRVLESILGKKHYNTALCYNRIAMILADKGAFKEAMDYHMLALDIDREHYGSCHNSVATDLSNVASLLTSHGEYEKALPVINECLQIRKKLNGKQHKSIAFLLNNLGCVQRALGRNEEAEKSFLESINISKKALRKDHPEMAIRMGNLAELYLLMERYDEADKALKKALHINIAALGVHHPRTGVTLYLLAELLYAQDLLEEAREVYSQVLDIDTSYYGRKSAKVARDLSTLGQLLMTLGEFSQAEDMLYESLQIRVDLFGKKDATTAKSMEAVALLKAATGDKQDALGYGLAALEIYEATLGESHQITEEARVRWC